MRFELLTIADAANRGPEGKLNVLGMGARILTFAELPGSAPLVLLGSIAAMTTEAGIYPLRVTRRDPDGSEHVLVEADGVVPSEAADDRIPTGIAFTIGMSGPFTQEGVYQIVATLGDDLREEWPFVVRLKPRRRKRKTPLPK
jgi:hypothetical protein